MTTARRTRNSWQPVYGDDIGPTRAQRTRSAVLLAVVLFLLGVAFAGFIGLVVLAMLAAVGASVG